MVCKQRNEGESDQAPSNDTRQLQIENQITLDGTGVPVTNHMVLLGMTIDNKLKFDMHVAGVCRNVGRQINVLNRLKNILPLKTKEALYHSFVLPYFQGRRNWGGRRGSCPPCLLLGGARGAKVPFKYKEYYNSKFSRCL